MDTCLLCLKAPHAFNSYIPINSQKWWQSDVLGIIEKHFWPVDDQPNALGICFLCWSKLNEFHIFYQNIEEAHRRITDISKTKFANCCIETEIFQTSAAQVGKSNIISNGKTQFAVEEIANDIKIENSFDEYEHIICETSTRTSDQITPNPISIEKRKRGRPRKHKVHEKPKGKRGRPRKDSKLVVHNANLAKSDTVQHFKHTKELTSPQCGLTTTVSNGSPVKKRARGRPRKVQNNNENSSRTEDISDLLVAGGDVISLKESSQGDKLINDKLSNLDEAERIVNKKRKFLSLMKKRKPVQQHKALMRNYIATSVRCMKFLKK